MFFKLIQHLCTDIVFFGQLFFYFQIIFMDVIIVGIDSLTCQHIQCAVEGIFQRVADSCDSNNGADTDDDAQHCQH